MKPAPPRHQNFIAFVHNRKGDPGFLEIGALRSLSDSIRSFGSNGHSIPICGSSKRTAGHSGNINIRAFVDDFALRLERHKPVEKAFRHKKLTAIVK